MQQTCASLGEIMKMTNLDMYKYNVLQENHDSFLNRMQSCADIISINIIQYICFHEIGMIEPTTLNPDSKKTAKLIWIIRARINCLDQFQVLQF